MGTGLLFLCYFTFHDIITGHNEPFWRNLRLTDTLEGGGKEVAVSNLTVLHKKRLQYLEKI